MSTAERAEKLRLLRERKNQRPTTNLVDEILRGSEITLQKELKEALEEKEEQVIVKPKKKQELKFVQFIGEVHISPKEKVETYSQEIQVDLGQSDEPMPRTSVGRSVHGRGDKDVEDEDELMALPQKGAARLPNKPAEEELNGKEAEKNEKKEISEQEVKNILKSKDFKDFFERSSKIIEKALDTKEVDVFEDIFLDENAGQYQDVSSKKEFQELHNFFDLQHCSNRVVTAIEWSPNLPELFMSSYSQNLEGNPNDPQGVLLLWSLALRSRPEFTCFCQSQITTAKFNPYSNSTIVGGTYSGQIIMWDLRTKSTPVQRSGIAGGGHAHPVYALTIVGTQNSHNIVSLSNDGKLCLWNTSMLTAPQKEVDLRIKTQGANGESIMQDIVNATCLSFSNEEANNFFLGCEDGNIYSAQVHGNQANENIVDTYSGHQATVTSLSQMPSTPDLSLDTSNLLLSSSYDWSVKLWNPKQYKEPICSFEASEDFVYDVSWNPSNPTLFSSVDGEGYVNIWDISKDVEAPYIHHRGDTRALNKVSWSRDGSKLLTGSADGHLKLYGLHKNLLKPSNETLNKFDNQIFNLTKKEKKD